MNVLAIIRSRFRSALESLIDDPADVLDMIRTSQDSKFGDYQANCAMPLGKRLDKPPREIAQQIVDSLEIDDLCDVVEIAGPGFINLRLRDDFLIDQLTAAVHDDRLGVDAATIQRKYVIDYSSPNVAKPMHVGHIRSTVIGDALCKILRFLGHEVISDNHLGDWGTQFGMILYGYKNFRDEQSYNTSPVAELSRLYRLVVGLIDYHSGKQKLPQLEADVIARRAAVEDQRSLAPSGDKQADKKVAKALRRLESQADAARQTLEDSQRKIAEFEADADAMALAAAHPDIARAVLRETAALHAGDAENLSLWNEFLPQCRADIQRVYDRLDIKFDVEHGESFYHDRLSAVVQSMEQAELARESEGATCVFLDGFDTPMIIRKQDGAYLYATTDLATIDYRMQEWSPDAMLYVVDHRQGEHFDKLFAAARLWRYGDVEFQHVSFGTVLGEDGRPYKTRSGDTVGLEGLLDEAEQKAYEVVCENDVAGMPDEQRRKVASVVGMGALKYADLSHNRTSDYVFSYDKMLNLKGNTATYMQYAYARVRSIFARGQLDADELRRSSTRIVLGHPAERELGKELLRFSEALEQSSADYRPNHLTNYLFDLAKRYSTFFEECHVLKAGSDELRDSRLILCDLTARTIRCGLALLGVDVVEKM